jgi:hypothetical protein
MNGCEVTFVIQIIPKSNHLNTRVRPILEIIKYTSYDNKKLNRLQSYDVAQSYRILHEVVQRLSHLNLKITYRRHI